MIKRIKISTMLLCVAVSVTCASAEENPHFSTNSASYVPSNAHCSDCHNSAANNADIRQSWKASGHANVTSPAWIAYDFKNMNSCVQCHTTTGFIAYSSGKNTGAWGNASDTTKEVLACNGCHTDIATGALRTAARVQPYAYDSYRNQDAGPSNLCVGCHSGTMSGRSIKALPNFNTSFTGSHFFAASGILFKSIGYEFDGQNYSNKSHFKHDRIGINNYTGYGYSTAGQGPCIACHMSSSDKHSYAAVTKDATGAVTTVSGAICAGCHTTPAFLDAARMNNRKTRYSTSLLALQKVLEGLGVYYNTTKAPYFFTDGTYMTPYTTWGNADKMGAAFNLHLLIHESGAYAHNMIYAKRLIYDSIDYLDDGVFNGSVSPTINALSGLDATQKSTAIGYSANAGARP